MQPPAIDIRKLSHDRQSQTCSRLGLIQPLAPLQRLGAMFRRKARAVVIDDNLEPVIASGHLYLDPRLAPFGGVLQQVPDKFIEIALLAAEDGLWISVDIDRDALVPMQTLE